MADGEEIGVVSEARRRRHSGVYAEEAQRAIDSGVTVHQLMAASRRSRTWRVIRIVWVTAGLVFMLYLVLSYFAWGVDERVLRSGGGVEVADDARSMRFTPADGEGRPGLIFIPGGMVDPRAYAPLLHGIASAGHPVILVKHPHLGGRHAMGEDGRRETVARALIALEAAPGEARWIVAGHSLGGAIAARLARTRPARMAGLVLLGTTHPRDFSIADFPHPVIKVYGTRDGIAPLAKSKPNAHNLPPSTRWIAIEGGNHSQFGYYGFQLLDGRARISREEQQRQILEVLLEPLEAPWLQAGAARALP
ncbi:MAG TPA: alpha/beta fold hydrolase [Thermoanaerobaculia bacterium]|nr:alpha/beta fold hydrolase [Thermoanaerobaculia bacterium]